MGLCKDIKFSEITSYHLYVPNTIMHKGTINITDVRLLLTKILLHDQLVYMSHCNSIN